METRKQTFEQFQQSTNEALEKLTTMFHKLVTDVQAIRERDSDNSSGSSKSISVRNEGKPYMKLHFPRFSGDDPTGWIYQAEQYFEFQNVADEDRVTLASFHLDGIALQWHRWFSKPRGPMTWKEFTTALLSRFGPTDYVDPSKSLHRLKLITTVEAYIEAFERLSHRVDNLLESFLLGCFSGGPKEEIRLEVKLKKPRTVADAMGLSRLVEEKLSLQRWVPPSTRAASFNPPSKAQPTGGILGPAPSQCLALPAPSSVRREKGLCYYCDDLYSLGHKCNKPQLFMISEVDDTEEGKNNVDEGDDTPLDEVPAEISFHAISGTILPQTLRMPVKIHNKDVVVLVDGGSTHNFIEQSLVERFGLVVDNGVKLEVVVANHENLACVGRVRGLTIVIQGYTITTDFLSYQLQLAQLS
ncbi:unnamed protein product [Cuscuta campestris]|uniref:Ty3 transposon capsid-like protein domain-containing protein n=1 Tax=Cuscuta campestris TaxID=132261 RepID=A0A484KTB6_9ASTE|nr:unnamed protein product [Cuscuta campestris]